VANLSVENKDFIIEIGGGTGALTNELIRFCNKYLKLFVFEVDNDLIKHLKIRISGKKNRKKLQPYYENFKGEIISIENNRFITRGVYKKINNNEIQILELPIGVWTENYHLFLEKLIEKKIIKDYIKHSNNKDINIIIIFNRGELLKHEKENQLYNLLGLETLLSYNNMMLFDKFGKLKKYNTPEDIIDDFYETRLDFYKLRKKYLISKLKNDKSILYNKIRFIKLILNQTIIIKNTKKEKVIKNLEELKFQKFDNNYDYLLNLKFINLTYEKLQELKKLYEKLKTDIILFEKKEITDIWIDDLNILNDYLKK
jgi:DNA topoisomerase-2